MLKILITTSQSATRKTRNSTGRSQVAFNSAVIRAPSVRFAMLASDLGSLTHWQNLRVAVSAGQVDQYTRGARAYEQAYSLVSLQSPRDRGLLCCPHDCPPIRSHRRRWLLKYDRAHRAQST